MLPWLSLGRWQITTYNAAIAIAALVATTYSLSRLAKLGLPLGLILRVFWPTILAGLAGAFVWPRLGASLGVNTPHSSGFIGLLLFGGGTGLLSCLIWKAPLGKMFDAGGALPTPLGQVIGRLGCLAAGCCGGRPTDGFLGVCLPDASGTWQSRYPTQPLAAGFDLLLFLGLSALERRARGRARWYFDGILALSYLFLYSAKRFGMEFLRADAGPALYAGLNAVQWLCLLSMLIFGATLMGNLARRRQHFSHTSA